MGKYYINEDNMTGLELWTAILCNEVAESNRIARIKFTTEHGEEWISKDEFDKIMSSISMEDQA